MEARVVFEPVDQFAEIMARDFAQPRDGVEREQDAQEGQEQFDHGGYYPSGPMGGDEWRQIPHRFLR